MRKICTKRSLLTCCLLLMFGFLLFVPVKPVQAAKKWRTVFFHDNPKIKLSWGTATHNWDKQELTIKKKNGKTWKYKDVNGVAVTNSDTLYIVQSQTYPVHSIVKVTKNKKSKVIALYDSYVELIGKYKDKLYFRGDRMYADVVSVTDKGKEKGFSCYTNHCPVYLASHYLFVGPYTDKVTVYDLKTGKKAYSKKGLVFIGTTKKYVYYYKSAKVRDDGVEVIKIARMKFNGKKSKVIKTVNHYGYDYLELKNNRIYYETVGGKPVSFKVK